MPGRCLKNLKRKKRNNSDNLGPIFFNINWRSRYFVYLGWWFSGCIFSHRRSVLAVLPAGPEERRKIMSCQNKLFKSWSYRLSKAKYTGSGRRVGITWLKRLDFYNKRWMTGDCEPGFPPDRTGRRERLSAILHLVKRSSEPHN